MLLGLKIKYENNDDKKIIEIICHNKANKCRIKITLNFYLTYTTISEETNLFHPQGTTTQFLFSVGLN